MDIFCALQGPRIHLEDTWRRVSFTPNLRNMPQVSGSNDHLFLFTALLFGSFGGDCFNWSTSVVAPMNFVDHLPLEDSSSWKEGQENLNYRSWCPYVGFLDGEKIREICGRWTFSLELFFGFSGQLGKACPSLSMLSFDSICVTLGLFSSWDRCWHIPYLPLLVNSCFSTGWKIILNQLTHVWSVEVKNLVVIRVNAMAHLQLWSLTVLQVNP